MNKIILDVSSLYLEEVFNNIDEIKENLLGVIISSDVKNYEVLSKKAKKLFSQKGIPVYKGSKRAIMDNSYNEKFILDEENLEDFESIHAAEFILNSIKNEKEVDIITFGPLTNTALALLKDENTFNKIKNIYVVAGALLGFQTTTETSQHSILADTYAADLVLKSDNHIVLIPPHTLNEVVKDSFKIYFGQEYEYYNAFVEVDTSNSFSNGQTIIDVVGKNPITHTVTTGKRKKVVRGIL